MFTEHHHIYTLSATTENYLNRTGGKLYVAFTDLRKTFDSVDRASLFLTFVKAGLSGPFLNVIKAVVFCVRVHNNVTDFFFFFFFFLLSLWCQTGVYSESCSLFLVCK